MPDVQVQVSVEGLMAMVKEMRRQMERAAKFLRDPDLDDADRIEAALDVLEN